MIMNRVPTFRQAERGIDRYESRPSFFNEVVNGIVAERHARFSAQIAQHTQTCRSLRRPGEIDADYNQRSVLNHGSFSAALRIRP